MNPTVENIATWLVYTFAVMRLCRLINFDYIMDPIRVALVKAVRGNPPFVVFITCPWCVSIWVVAFTAWLPLYFAHNPVVQYAAIILAVSHIVGIASPLSDDPTVHAEPDDDDEQQ